MKTSTYSFVAVVLFAFILLSGCASQKKYNLILNERNDAVIQLKELDKSFNIQGKYLTGELDRQYARFMLELATKDSLLNALSKELNYYRASNNNLLSRLTDLSVINKTGAESIKQSLMAINEQNNYIRDLTKSIQSKDSLNMVLVLNLKRSLVDINDEDVHVEVKKGVIYISLSDKMLYKSGSSEINPKAHTVLSKIAKIITDHKELEVLVEGHTDNVPIATTLYADNWDLSVKRATSVVRVLQWKYNIEPDRMTAGGRSEYVSKTSNSTPHGRQLNRRTEIILLPQLDQFFKLLQSNTNATTSN